MHMFICETTSVLVGCSFPAMKSSRVVIIVTGSPRIISNYTRSTMADRKRPFS